MLLNVNICIKRPDDETIVFCKYLHNYIIKNYVKFLQKKKKLPAIACEEKKTLYDLYQIFMKEIFYSSPNLAHRKDNFHVHSRNIIKFGNKRSLGAYIWNTLPENIK